MCALVRRDEGREWNGTEGRFARDEGVLAGGRERQPGAAGRFAGGGGVGRFARDAGAFWLDLSAIVRYNIP
ncbi:MAG: hypothetical protein BHW56_02915 [Acetobacter sp. 46_36]|nr:MAG: hypothetical protein BHW56_02915 [Acetobacter sp. 46_36]